MTWPARVNGIQVEWLSPEFTLLRAPARADRPTCSPSRHPSLEILRAFQRSLARIGLSRRELPKTDASPPVGDPTDIDLCVLQFVEETCLQGGRLPTLDADAYLGFLLRDLVDAEYSF